MREFLGPLLCTLLAVPDNPEAGVLELPKLALAAAAQYGWDPRLPARCGALLDGVRLLAAMARDQYPYCYQVPSLLCDITCTYQTYLLETKVRLLRHCPNFTSAYHGLMHV